MPQRFSDIRYRLLCLAVFVTTALGLTSAACSDNYNREDAEEVAEGAYVVSNRIAFGQNNNVVATLNEQVLQVREYDGPGDDDNKVNVVLPACQLTVQPANLSIGQLFLGDLVIEKAKAVYADQGNITLNGGTLRSSIVAVNSATKQVYNLRLQSFNANITEQGDFVGQLSFLLPNGTPVYYELGGQRAEYYNAPTTGGNTNTNVAPNAPKVQDSVNHTTPDNSANTAVSPLHRRADDDAEDWAEGFYTINTNFTTATNAASLATLTNQRVRITEYDGPGDDDNKVNISIPAYTLQLTQSGFPQQVSVGNMVIERVHVHNDSQGGVVLSGGRLRKTAVAINGGKSANYTLNLQGFSATVSAEGVVEGVLSFALPQNQGTFHCQLKGQKLK